MRLRGCCSTTAAASSARAGLSDDEEMKDAAVAASAAAAAAAAAPASGRSGLSLEDEAKSESGEEDYDASSGVDPITDVFNNWTYAQLSHFVQTYEKENDISIEGEDQKAEGRTGQKRNRKDLFDCALHIFSNNAGALPTYLANSAASAASQQWKPSATPSKRNRTPSLSALVAAASAPSNQLSTPPSSTKKKKRTKTMTVSATKKGSTSTSSFLANTLQLKIVGEGEPLHIVFDHDRISWERAGIEWSWVINTNWLALGNTVQQLINKMLRTDMSLPVVDWITMERVAEKASSLSESIAAAPFEYDTLSGTLTAVEGDPFTMQKDTIANARKQLIVAETTCHTTC